MEPKRLLPLFLCLPDKRNSCSNGKQIADLDETEIGFLCSGSCP